MEALQRLLLLALHQLAPFKHVVGLNSSHQTFERGRVVAFLVLVTCFKGVRDGWMTDDKLEERLEELKKELERIAEEIGKMQSQIDKRKRPE